MRRDVAVRGGRALWTENWGRTLGGEQHRPRGRRQRALRPCEFDARSGHVRPMLTFGLLPPIARDADFRSGRGRSERLLADADGLYTAGPPSLPQNAAVPDSRYPDLGSQPAFTQCDRFHRSSDHATYLLSDPRCSLLLLSCADPLEHIGTLPGLAVSAPTTLPPAPVPPPHPPVPPTDAPHAATTRHSAHLRDDVPVRRHGLARTP